MLGGGAVGVGLNDAVGATDAGGGGGARACGGCCGGAPIWCCCCGCIGVGTIIPGVIGGAACCGGGAVGRMLLPPYAEPPYAGGIEGGAPMLPAATCAATEYADDMDAGIDA